MKKTPLTEDYWEERYQSNSTGWNLGDVSPPLKAYIDQLSDYSKKILIPGAGFAHEANYCLQKGFTNTHICDWSETAMGTFRQDYPDFPLDNIHIQNFFELDYSFDLILEQTFFCALDPKLRTQYAEKMYELLIPGGKLVGLLFNFEFEKNGPPFGGSRKDYINLFSPYFKIKTMESCYNSVAPRSGNELFFILEKL